MINAEVKAKYRVTVGIECHVQLKTKTKLFSAVGNDAREAPPNTLVSHIDFGLPGALPVLNKDAIELAARAAFALHSTPQLFSKFDRKHYFYPDLPMGYQITQYDEPVILGGHVDVDVDGETKRIGITRAHLEADAGKSTHPAGKDYSLVDLNRAGTPLLEIVSEPDMHTAAEAKAYAHELYLRMRYADVSDCNLYYGNMRFDVNVSVSQTDDLGTRTETKNLNSFRAVEKTVEYETERQIEKLEKGEAIAQETRGWNDAKQRTFSQRTKENADDYRYMPDPDLPPVVLTKDYVERVKAGMTTMPDAWRQKLQSLGLDRPQIETLLESQVNDEIDYLSIVERASSDKAFGLFVANAIVNTTIPYVSQLREQGKTISSYNQDRLYAGIYELIKANKLSSTNARFLIQKCLDPTTTNSDSPIEQLAEAAGLIQVSDEAEIARIVADVIAENPKAAEDVRQGEMKAIGYLVGQVMKRSAGRANPSLTQNLIKTQLGS
jgi:aspartyl-tRNA(Asn)/glutamyl-tRNA(Gln) amidotransferase subunit B